MAYLSPVELSRVALLRPELLSLLMQHMALFEQDTNRKTYVSDKGGLRTTAVQAAIYADSVAHGFRAAPAGHSKHEWGAAYDIHIVGIPDDDAANQRDPLYERLATIGESLGLKAGKHYKTGKPDPYHFELIEPDAVSRAKWAELTRGRLWRAAIVGALAVAVVLWWFFRRSR